MIAENIELFNKLTLGERRSLAQCRTIRDQIEEYLVNSIRDTNKRAEESGVGVSNQSVEYLSVGLCQECVFTCGRNEPRKILKGHLANRIADCRRRLDLPVTKAGVLKGGAWEETVVIRKL